MSLFRQKAKGVRKPSTSPSYPKPQTLTKTISTLSSIFPPTVTSSSSPTTAPFFSTPTPTKSFAPSPSYPVAAATTPPPACPPSSPLTSTTQTPRLRSWFVAAIFPTPSTLSRQPKFSFQLFMTVIGSNYTLIKHHFYIHI